MKKLLHTVLKLLVGAILGGGLATAIFAVVSSAHYPLTNIKIDLKSGQRIFAQRCQSCHSLDGNSSRGPSLKHIGRLAQSRISDQSAEEYILESILFPSKFLTPGAEGVMPENVSQGLSSEQILSLVGFLSSLDGEVRIKKLLALKRSTQVAPKETDKPVIDAKLAEQGRKLFIGKLNCLECHALDAYPGHDLIAPSLLNAGLNNEKHLRESILQPNIKVSPRYSTVLIDDNGLVSSGSLVTADEHSLTVITKKKTGGYGLKEYDLLDHNELEVAYPKTSMMPSYKNKITEEELTAVVVFLKSLR